MGHGVREKRLGALNAKALRQRIKGYLYIFESLPSQEGALNEPIERLRAFAEEVGDERVEERAKRLEQLVREAKGCVDWSRLGVAGKTALFNQLQRGERYLELKPEIDPCLTEVFFKR